MTYVNLCLLYRWKMPVLRLIASHDDGEQSAVYVSLLGLGVREDAPFFLSVERLAETAGILAGIGFQPVRTSAHRARPGVSGLFLD
ncbi:MAG: hypothetical protein KUL79_07000 [Thauera sp.]|nr:hypothetical protein [Thauera sp.]